MPISISKKNPKKPDNKENTLHNKFKSKIS